MKVYGLDSTKSKRELLIQILRERMDNHKDKFVSKRIYDELIGMEVKKNGKVEHSSNTHDDLVFSYLMAMYMWYEGKDLRERFGIVKTAIKTDEAVDEVAYGLEEHYADITEEINNANSASENKEYIADLNDVIKSGGKLYEQFAQEEKKKDDIATKQALDQMIKIENANRKYAKLHNLQNTPTDPIVNPGFDAVLPSNIFTIGGIEDEVLDPNKNPNDILPSNWNSLDNY